MDITVIEPAIQHLYQPGLLFVPFGRYRASDLLKPIRPLLTKGILLIDGEVERIMPTENKVLLVDGRTLDYDQLVIATGTHPRPDLTPGMLGSGPSRTFTRESSSSPCLTTAATGPYADFCRAQGTDLLTAVHTYQDKLIAGASRSSGRPCCSPAARQRRGGDPRRRRELDASLVVVGSRRWSGVKRGVLGRIAQGPIRRGHNSVLVVRPETAEIYASA